MSFTSSCTQTNKPDENAAKTGNGTFIGQTIGTAITLGNPIGTVIGGVIGGALVGGYKCDELCKQKQELKNRLLRNKNDEKISN